LVICKLAKLIHCPGGDCPRWLLS